MTANAVALETRHMETRKALDSFTSTFASPHKRTIPYEPPPITPGPGHYNTAHGKDTRLRSVTISSSFKTPSIHQGGIDPTPGPGDYNDNFVELCKESHPSYSVRTRLNTTTMDPANNTPGPPAYSHFKDPIPNIQTAHWVIPSFNPINKPFEPSPGPGSYKTMQAIHLVKEKHPTYKIGERTAVYYPNESPGPAKYTKSGYIGKGMAKSISAKDLQISDRNAGEPSFTPGPGAYLTHSSSTPVLKRAPNYTWSAKRHSQVARTQKGNMRVGPGLYEGYPDWNHPKSPAQPMQGRHRDRQKDLVPGPNYMPKDDRKMQYTMMGKNDYADRTKEVYRNPGPGEYESAKSWESCVYHDSTKVSMASKPTTFRREYSSGELNLWLTNMGIETINCKGISGEAFYRKSLREMKTILGSQAGIRIYHLIHTVAIRGLDPRVHGLKHGAPKANVSKSQTAPSYTMPGRIRSKVEVSQPGPGHYHIKNQDAFNKPKIKRLC